MHTCKKRTVKNDEMPCISKKLKAGHKRKRLNRTSDTWREDDTAGTHLWDTNDPGLFGTMAKSELCLSIFYWSVALLVFPPRMFSCCHSHGYSHALG